MNKLRMDEGDMVILDREIAILRELDHPNIVRFERYFEDEAAVYLLLELCDNQVRGLDVPACSSGMG